MKVLPQQSGFTLVETLVAVAILMLAIGGPMTIATRGLTSSIYSRDQLVASYLAQEAVEFVRNARDENTLKGGASNWLSGGSGGIPLTDCTGSGVCRIDVFASAPSGWVEPCPQAGCPPLSFDPAAGYYTYGSGSASPFVRSVTIRPVAGNSDEIRVTATISWDSGVLSRTFKLEEYLTNWQEAVAP